MSQFTADAQAIINVSIDKFKKMFQYKTDTSNIDNVLIDENSEYKNDSEYWNEMNDISGFNILNSQVQRSEYDVSTNHNHISHDFIRHIGDELFNRKSGAGFFKNKNNMVNNLKDISSGVCNEINNNIINILNANNSVYSNQDDVSFNFCRKLIEQLNRSQLGKDRFNNNNNNTSSYQDFPFIVGDEIHIKLNIKPCEGQNTLTGQEHITNRSYLVRMVLV
jgi:hypothetical protein